MKLQVNVSDDLVKEIDKYAKMMGVSRSALCATLLGQGIMGYNRSFQMFDSLEGDIMAAFRKFVDGASDPMAHLSEEK